MRNAAARTVLLLPLLLTGCFHHTRAKNFPVAPPLEHPAIHTESVSLPPSAAAIPTVPTRNLWLSNRPVFATSQFHRRQTRSVPEASANDSAPEVSALGQLSSGDPVAYRRQTEDSILTTEKSLNRIARSLTGSQQKTAANIREFLKQARMALASGDVDGAHTLAAKAQVLLAELTR